MSTPDQQYMDDLIRKVLTGDSKFIHEFVNTHSRWWDTGTRTNSSSTKNTMTPEEIRRMQEQMERAQKQGRTQSTIDALRAAMMKMGQQRRIEAIRKQYREMGFEIDDAKVLFAQPWIEVKMTEAKVDSDFYQ